MPDPEGRPYRQWRPHIRSVQDIWKEIQKAAQAPGLTSAPELMPIAARIVMLHSGMRAPMGLKVRGPDLDTIERVGLQLERLLKQVPSIRPDTVVADRIVGKPYLEIVIDRAGRFYVDDRAVTDREIGTLKRAMTDALGEHETLPVLVKADAETPHQAVMRVLDAAGQLNLIQVSFAASRPEVQP